MDIGAARGVERNDGGRATGLDDWLIGSGIGDDRCGTGDGEHLRGWIPRGDTAGAQPGGKRDCSGCGAGDAAGSRTYTERAAAKALSFAEQALPFVHRYLLSFLLM